jgi:hypothetical protein
VVLMTSGKGRGAKPPGQKLREALRWMSAEARHDAAAVEEACRRFDLSPLDEEFLLLEAHRLRHASNPAGPKRDSSGSEHG